MGGAADAVFALAARPGSALVLGDAPGWTDALDALGIKPDHCSPTLVVAAGDRLAEALRRTPTSLIVAGDQRRRLRRAGYSATVVLALPTRHEAELLVPVGDDPVVLRYLFDTWRRPGSIRQQFQRLAARGLAHSALLARARPAYTVGSRDGGLPFAIAAATDALGLPAPSNWLLASPGNDSLSRCVFLLFAAGANTPSWSVKLGRLPGAGDSFERDERGLRLVAAAGPAVASRAPRLLGRFVVEGHHGSVETAAVGEQLSRSLSRRGSRALPVVIDVAEWLVDVVASTRSAAGGARPELDRLAAEVLPAWGLPREILTALPPLPAVLAHHDLGPWNVVTDGRRFTVLDWESASETALPLWDLVYFLVHALALIDGATSADSLTSTMVALLRGESPSSELLYRSLREAAEHSGVPLECVPTIVTLCWLHHGRSHLHRQHALTEHGRTTTFVPPVERLARLWLDDPALGLDWPVWSRSQGSA